MFMTVLLAASLAAPVPKEKAVLYFPTAVGAKRVLETTKGGKTSETTDVVTKVEEKDGVFTVTTEWGGGGRQLTTRVFEVSAGKVRQVEETVGREGMPLDRTIIDLGVKAGDGWTQEFEVLGRKVVHTFTVGKEEEVEVPAGKFKAIPVTEETNTKKHTRWLAAGVGLVKEEQEWMKSKTVTVLKEFTPGTNPKK